MEESPSECQNTTEAESQGTFILYLFCLTILPHKISYVAGECHTIANMCSMIHHLLLLFLYEITIHLNQLKRIILHI